MNSQFLDVLPYFHPIVPMWSEFTAKGMFSPFLVTLNCCRRISYTGWLKQQTLVLIVLEAGNSRIEVLALSVSDEGLLPGS